MNHDERAALYRWVRAVQKRSRELCETARVLRSESMEARLERAATRYLLGSVAPRASHSPAVPIGAIAAAEEPLAAAST
jgi:hypothetical protein